MPAEEFRLDREAYLNARKKFLKNTAVGGIAGGIYLFVLILHVIRNNHGDARILMTGYFLLAGLVWAYLRYKKLSQEKNAIDGYRLLISSDSISCIRPGVETIDLSLLEIRQILKDKENNICVISGLSKEVINIPPHIERREYLEQLLNNITPIASLQTTRAATIYAAVNAITMVTVILILIKRPGREVAMTALISVAIASSLANFIKIWSDRRIASTARLRSGLLQLLVYAICVLALLAKMYNIRLLSMH